MATSRRLIDPSLNRLRSDLIQDQIGIWMASRAMARIFAAVAWLVLAALYAGPWGWAWGVPLLVSGVTSWLHASRRSLGRTLAWVTSLAPRAGRHARRFFRLSSDPDLVDGPRLFDLIGLVLASLATGRAIGIFTRVDAELAATGLLFASAVPTMANLVAHPTHARYAGPPPKRAQRRLAALAAGPLSVVLLWPDQATGPGRLIAVLGGLFLAGSALRWAVHLDRTAEAVEDGLDEAYRTALRELFLSLHNDLRNPARFVMNAVTKEVAAAKRLEAALDTLSPAQQEIVADWRKADDAARQLTWNLATRISEYVEMTRSGLAERPRTAVDIVDAILRLHAVAKDRHPRPVGQQLDPASLGALDNELIAACLTEFVTNAVVADTSGLDVHVRTQTADDGSTMIETRVTCSCGQTMAPGRPEDGTLGLLADHLELVNGHLHVEEHPDGSHTTIACWPTDALPAPLS